MGSIFLDHRGTIINIKEINMEATANLTPNAFAQIPEEHVMKRMIKRT